MPSSSGTMTPTDAVKLAAKHIARTANDKIDYNLGVITTKKIGDKVKIGDDLFKIYAKDLVQAKEVEKKLLSTILIK